MWSNKILKSISKMFISISRMFIFSFFFRFFFCKKKNYFLMQKKYYLPFFERSMNYQETSNSSFFLKKFSESRVRPKFISEFQNVYFDFQNVYFFVFFSFLLL